MSAKFALRSILILCVIMLLSTLVVSSAVSAQEITHDDPILGSAPEQTLQGGSPVPGGPGFISVSAFAFKPYNQGTDLSYSTAMLINNGTTLGYYFAPVNLPHAATINKVVFFYSDTSSGNLTLVLLRINLFDGSIQTVAYAYPTGNPGNGFIEGTIDNAVIDNQLYSYVLEAIIPSGYGSGLGLINVRIDYDYPVFLPTVQK